MEWTVLIYANGNNELEPEIWGSISSLVKEKFATQVNVIIQVGREARSLARLMRPYDEIQDEHMDNWRGVRRYLLKGDSLIVLEDLGKVNLADAKHLEDFIRWGMSLYQAKHTMVILSGHGASIVGLMPDLSGEYPYVMGVPEMCRALSGGIPQDGAIDILVLDTCDLNLVEVMYELTRGETASIRYVLTYIQGGPFRGMSYGKMVRSCETAAGQIEGLLDELVQQPGLDLVVVELSRRKLQSIKDAANRLGYLFFFHENSLGGINGIEMLKKGLMSDNLVQGRKHNGIYYKIYKAYKKLKKNLSAPVFAYNRGIVSTGGLLEIVSLEMNNPAVLALYGKFSFAKNNYWTYLLGGKLVSDLTDLPRALRLTKNGLRMNIKAVNPFLTIEQVDNILEGLLIYKGWNSENSPVC